MGNRLSWSPSNQMHIGIDQMLKLHEKYQPQKLYLTNMSHEVDYYQIKEDLPSDIVPAI